MAISNAVLNTAPTSITVTGGSALTFTSMAPGAKNELIVSADTDLRTRRTMTVEAKMAKPAVGAPNGYSQQRMTVLYRKPKLLANGKIIVNTVRVEMAYDVETTQTEIQELMDVGAQTLFDADFTALWKAGNPA